MTPHPAAAARAQEALETIEITRAHRSKLIDVGKRLSAVRGALQDRGEIGLALSVAESQNGLLWVVNELTAALELVADEPNEREER